MKCHMQNDAENLTTFEIQNQINTISQADPTCNKKEKFNCQHNEELITSLCLVPCLCPTGSSLDPAHLPHMTGRAPDWHIKHV